MHIKAKNNLQTINHFSNNLYGNIPKNSDFLGIAFIITLYAFKYSYYT